MMLNYFLSLIVYSRFAGRMMRTFWLAVLVMGCFSLASCGHFSSKSSEEGQSAAETSGTEQISKDIQSSPKNPALYFKRAVMYRKLNEDSLAMLDFKKAISLDSTKALYYSALGELLFDHKDVSGSVPLFQKALALNPDDEKSHLKMAKVFLFTAEYPKAFVEINTVLRTNVYNPEAYFLKGMCYKNMKDTAKAISSFQTAVQTDPQFADGYMQLALLYEAKKDPLALRYYENAYNANKKDLEPIYGQGMFWQNQEKYEEAKKVYKRIILLDANYPKAYYNLGWILLQQDSTEKALRQFDLAVQVQPDYADAFFNRGLCQEILGRKKEAIADYEQALTFIPDAPYVKDALKRIKK